MYQLRFSQNFIDGLTNAIRYWKQNNWIGPDKSKKFVSLVHKNVDILKVFPKVGDKVLHPYKLKLRQETRKIVIGNYLVFYRIDKKHQIVYLGSFLNNRQNDAHF